MPVMGATASAGVSSMSAFNSNGSGGEEAMFGEPYAQCRPRADIPVAVEVGVRQDVVGRLQAVGRKTCRLGRRRRGLPTH